MSQSSSSEQPKRKTYTVPMLSPLHDMDEIPIGHIHGGHIGLQVRINLEDGGFLHGHLIDQTNYPYVTKVRLRWEGRQLEHQSDPRSIVRIESTMGDE